MSIKTIANHFVKMCTWRRDAVAVPARRSRFLRSQRPGSRWQNPRSLEMRGLFIPVKPMEMAERRARLFGREDYGL